MWFLFLLLVMLPTLLSSLFCSVVILTANSQNYAPKIGNSTTLNLESFYGTAYTVQCDAYEYFSVMFPFPCQDLIITLRAHQGNPEIYVSKADVNKDPYPTREKLTWSATAEHYYTLTIDRYDPESSPGIYYIGIYNNCDAQNLPAKFEIQAMESSDPSVSAYLEDIYEYPRLGIGRTVAANEYAFFKFCVPVCANVLITLQNCVDNTLCPGKYSFPELLVSRTSYKPLLHDYRCLPWLIVIFMNSFP